MSGQKVDYRKFGELFPRLLHFLRTSRKRDNIFLRKNYIFHLSYIFDCFKCVYVRKSLKDIIMIELQQLGVPKRLHLLFLVVLTFETKIIQPLFM